MRRCSIPFVLQIMSNRIVRQDRVDLVGHCINEAFEELSGSLVIGLLYQLQNCELTGSIDADKEMEFTLFGSHLGDINMVITDWVAFVFLTLGFITTHIRQPRNAMPLKTTMQRKAGQVWDRRL